MGRVHASMPLYDVPFGWVGARASSSSFCRCPLCSVRGRHGSSSGARGTTSGSSSSGTAPRPSYPQLGESYPGARQKQLSGDGLLRLSSQLGLTHELLLQDTLMLMRRCEAVCGRRCEYCEHLCGASVNR